VNVYIYVNVLVSYANKQRRLQRIFYKNAYVRVGIPERMLVSQWIVKESASVAVGLFKRVLESRSDCPRDC